MITNLKNYLLKRVDEYVEKALLRISRKRELEFRQMKSKVLMLLDELYTLPKEIFEIPKVNAAQLQIYYIIRDMRELRAELSLLHESLEHVSKHIGQQTTNE